MIKNIVLDMGNVLIRFDPELFLSRYVLTAEQRILPCLPEPLHAVAQDLIEAWDEPLIPVRGMLELVRQLKQQGYQLYLCTIPQRASPCTGLAQRPAA